MVHNRVRRQGTLRKTQDSDSDLSSFEESSLDRNDIFSECRQLARISEDKIAGVVCGCDLFSL